MCVECYDLAAEQNRFDILKALHKGESNVSMLTKMLGIGQPTVSHHLKLLEEAKLIHGEKRGRERWFVLNDGSECFTDCGLLAGIVSKKQA